MKPLLRNLASVAVLATTGLLLVADGARNCEHAAQNVAFDVRDNTCGPNGTFRARVKEDRCSINTEGAQELGFPAFGDSNQDRVELRQGQWYLHDPEHLVYVEADGGAVPPDAGSPIAIRGNRHCETALEGDSLRLTCVDRRADPSSDEVARCEALLTPR